MSRNILFPVARLVGGSLYRGETKNQKGEALTFKDGSPRTDWSFGIAIAKGTETHWNQTAWGREIWAEGSAAAPAVHQSPAFAWKVTDGDSQIPNKKGKKPADREGYPGNWVLWFGGSYLPKIYNKDGSAPFIEHDAVKLGYFVQVFGGVGFNGQTESPGVYLNYNMVAFNAYGTEISVGPDASAVGFGQGAAPAGASAAPIGGMAQPPATVPAPPPVAAPAPAPAAPTAVAPAPSFLEVPTPAAPPAPPAGPQPTAKAGGATLEQMLAWPNWTLPLLISEGYVSA